MEPSNETQRATGAKPTSTGRKESTLDELGFYALAGGVDSARPIFDELEQAEQLGLGTAFVSERPNKETMALSGAALATTSKIRVATGVTNPNTRHPQIIASAAATLCDISGGRFVLGIGRGIDLAMRAIGLSMQTTAQLEDFAQVMRKLWRGETIPGHDGPIGRYPILRLGSKVRAQVPLMLAAFGPNSLALAGRCFDEVLLHTYFTDETTARVVGTAKRAAEAAGRDPADVKVWSCFATIGDFVPEEIRLKKTVGRLATYLQAPGYGELLVKTNRWDLAVLEKFRADPVVGGMRGAIDEVATPDQIEHVASLIPDAWFEGSATGSPEACASAVRGQFELGVDAVILHGGSPDILRPVIEAYRAGDS
ncbi:MAG: TIGR03857 family LLM class F420-dependent oxidoreductase [bacterium]|nr:TIGR03857 family LLM class F420-dependent oxidoreductase [bacterium]